MKIDYVKMMNTMFAVALGVIVFRLIAKMTKMDGETVLRTSNLEPKAMASGLPCGAPGAPSTYVSGSTGCNFLENCYQNGGVGTATQTGSGYELTCSKGGVLRTSSNGSALRPARRRRMF